MQDLAELVRVTIRELGPVKPQFMTASLLGQLLAQSRPRLVCGSQYPWRHLTAAWKIGKYEAVGSSPRRLVEFVASRQKGVLNESVWREVNLYCDVKIPLVEPGRGFDDVLETILESQIGQNVQDSEMLILKEEWLHETVMCTDTEIVVHVDCTCCFVPKDGPDHVVTGPVAQEGAERPQGQPPVPGEPAGTLPGQ